MRPNFLGTIPRKRKKIVMAITTMTILIGISFLFSWPHWWWKCSPSYISIDGKPFPQAKLYRGSAGSVLFYAPIPDETNLCYIINLQQSKVSVSNICTLMTIHAGGKFLVIPGAAYSLESNPLGIPMNSSKIEVNPRLIHTGKSFSFTSFSKRHMKIDI